MFKAKKLISVFLSVLMMLSVLSGCGRDKDPGTNEGGSGGNNDTQQVGDGLDFGFGNDYGDSSAGDDGDSNFGQGSDGQQSQTDLPGNLYLTESPIGFKDCDMVSRARFQLPEEKLNAAIPITDYFVGHLVTAYADAYGDEEFQSAAYDVKPMMCSPIEFWNSTMYMMVDQSEGVDGDPQEDGYLMVASWDNDENYTLSDIRDEDMNSIVDSLLNEAMSALDSVSSNIQTGDGEAEADSAETHAPVVTVISVNVDSDNNTKALFHLDMRDVNESSMRIGTGFATVVVTDTKVIVGVAVGVGQPPADWYEDFIKSIQYDDSVIGRDPTDAEMTGPIMTLLQLYYPDIEITD